MKIRKQTVNKQPREKEVLDYIINSKFRLGWGLMNQTSIFILVFIYIQCFHDDDKERKYYLVPIWKKKTTYGISGEAYKCLNGFYMVSTMLKKKQINSIVGMGKTRVTIIDSRS